MEEKIVVPYLYIPMSFYDEISEMENVEVGEIFKAIFEYAQNNKKTKFKDRFMNLLFTQIAEKIDFNSKKYQNICERNRKNIAKRWSKETIENQGKMSDEILGNNLGNNDEKNTTGKTGITKIYENIPSDTKEKVKSVKVKSKKENKNKKCKKEKNNKKEKNGKMVDDYVATNTTATLLTSFSPSYSFEYILKIGVGLGIDEVYCKKFFDYYNSIGWITANGEEIKNIKPLLKKWYNEDEKNKQKKVITKEGIENDTRRIFGSI